MLRFVRFVLVRSIASALAILVVMALATRARAEAPGGRAVPVHVLGIDSDDAEDQADAMTGALRSRIRSAPGLSLQETQHSLAMLVAALRCPARPDAACLQKIGDQLKADRFLWGYVSKAPGNQVTADIHLWARGRPDVSMKETYSDNLKDQNDETLARIATRVLEKLGLASTAGSITVHAGDVADAAVWVDGQRKRPLERGSATVEAAPGSHSVEVRAKGFLTSQQEVVVSGGQDSIATFRMSPEPAAAPSSEPAAKSGMSARRIVAFGLIGAGVVAGVVAGVEGFKFLSDKNDLDNARAQVPASVSDVCAASAASNPSAATACSKYNDAKDARTTGVLVGSAGAVAIATGLVLIFTEHPHEGSATGDKAVGSDGPRVRVLPYAGAREAGVGLTVTF